MAANIPAQYFSFDEFSIGHYIEDKAAYVSRNFVGWRNLLRLGRGTCAWNCLASVRVFVADGDAALSRGRMPILCAVGMTFDAVPSRLSGDRWSWVHCCCVLRWAQQRRKKPQHKAQHKQCDSLEKLNDCSRSVVTSHCPPPLRPASCCRAVCSLIPKESPPSV